MCIGAMVTARRSARVSSVPMDIAAVEQSFGELLAALGDIVVARSRGRAGRSRRRLDDRPRAPLPARAGGASRRDLAELPMPARSAATTRAALANMRGSLDWLDPLEPTPGARPDPPLPGPAGEDAGGRPGPGRARTGDIGEAAELRSGSAPRRSIG